MVILMRGLLWVLLFCAACKGDNNSGPCPSNDQNNNYRSGATCSNAGTCPPNQICTSENVCRRICSTPELSGTSGTNCECSGPIAPGTLNGDACDIDHYCRQRCSGGPPGPGQCTQSSGCPSGTICDSLVTICRRTCTGPDGGTCGVGFECVVDTSNGCNICRPKPAAGSLGGACATGDRCGTGLTCDPVSKTCLLNCGTGSMACGNFGNCPNSFGCDPAINACRPLCQGGQCPNGGTCSTPAGSSCPICTPS